MFHSHIRGDSRLLRSSTPSLAVCLGRSLLTIPLFHRLVWCLGQGQAWKALPGSPSLACWWRLSTCWGKSGCWQARSPFSRARRHTFVRHRRLRIWSFWVRCLTVLLQKIKMTYFQRNTHIQFIFMLSLHIPDSNHSIKIYLSTSTTVSVSRGIFIFSRWLPRFCKNKQQQQLVIDSILPDFNNKLLSNLYTSL